MVEKTDKTGQELANQRESIHLSMLDIATIITLFGALIYTTGWTYAYHYFGHFKLGLLTTEIPNHYFLMYGFWVLKTWWWLVALFYLLFIFSTLYLKPVLKNSSEKGRILALHLQNLAILIAFVLAWWLAVKQAQDYYLEQQHQGFTAYPLVRVWPKTTESGHEKLRNLYQTLPKAEYRLLLQTREKLFLIKPPQDRKPARPAILQLNQLETNAMKILP